MGEFLYEVEDDVPPPPPHEFNSQKHKYPFPRLERPGQSFFIPGMKSAKMSSAIANARKRFPGRTYRSMNTVEQEKINGVPQFNDDGSRKMVAGCRIWREADVPVKPEND